MVFKRLTFWVFPASKRGCFRKFLKKKKLVQLMLLKKLNFWVFPTPKNEWFSTIFVHAHLVFSRRVIWYLLNIFSIFQQFSSDLQKTNVFWVTLSILKPILLKKKTSTKIIKTPLRKYFKIENESYNRVKK